MKFSTLIKLIGSATLGAGIAFVANLAPASAISLVPQQEGELNVGLGTALANSYIATPGFSITSLVDSSTGTKSRLFVDKAGTANSYGNGAIQFLASDIGTSEVGGSYWFRPVTMQANGVTPLVENGQLEVGTFKFAFDKTIEQLTVRWFDTEYANTTSFNVNGSSEIGFVPAGADKNIYTKTFTNVSSLVLNLGERGGKFGTGDGVNFQAEAVPEPMTMAGVALAGAGLSWVRRRRQSV